MMKNASPDGAACLPEGAELGSFGVGTQPAHGRILDVSKNGIRKHWLDAQDAKKHHDKARS